MRLAREGQVWGRLFASRARKKTPFDNGQSKAEAIRRPLPSLIGQAHGTPHKRLAYTLPIPSSYQSIVDLTPPIYHYSSSSYTTIRVRLNKSSINLSRYSKQRPRSANIKDAATRTRNVAAAASKRRRRTRIRALDPFFGTLSLARFLLHILGLCAAKSSLPCAALPFSDRPPLLPAP